MSGMFWRSALRLERKRFPGISDSGFCTASGRLLAALHWAFRSNGPEALGITWQLGGGGCSKGDSTMRVNLKEPSAAFYPPVSHPYLWAGGAELSYSSSDIEIHWVLLTLRSDTHNYPGVRQVVSLGILSASEGENGNLGDSMTFPRPLTWTIASPDLTQIFRPQNGNGHRAKVMRVCKQIVEWISRVRLLGPRRL